MEHAQRAIWEQSNCLTYGSLNPYFNGTCSKSYLQLMHTTNYSMVLILILMEHAQRGLVITTNKTAMHVS